ncbi:MAG: type II toxin-antitoxin system HicB family antitoxin [Solirubrobacterales bacterium]
MSEYVVIYEQAEDGGWGAHLPDLPGVVALGQTRGEVERGIYEALEAYAVEARQNGCPLPVPVHQVGTVSV